MAAVIPSAHGALRAVMEADRGRLLAALIADLRDFQMAEDALQEAAASAIVHWQRSGVPRNPAGWLMQVARRKAIDRIRRARSFSAKSAEYAGLLAMDQADAAEEAAQEITDHRLRLIFTCCHPAIEAKTRVALTLRTLGGLSTAEIARAFLDSETAMGQRLSRAKAKILAAGIPFVVPEPEDWEARLASVLAVIYLIYNEGYSAQEGESAVRASLCEEAIYLARMVDGLRPKEAEVEGLLALMLLGYARRDARRAGGGTVPLAEQDSTRWDAAMRDEGLAVLDRAVARLQSGPYQVQAAISALHMQRGTAGEVDWRQILMLYDRLYQMEATPVVRLNRAVALAEVAGAARGLAELDAIADELEGYQPYYAARAALLVGDGQIGAAREAYDQAIEFSRNTVDIRFLTERRDAL